MDLENTWNEKMLDELQEMVYIIDTDTYQLLAANRRVKDRFPEYRKGVPCYQLFFGRSTPCEQCGVGIEDKNRNPVILNKTLEDGSSIRVAFRSSIGENGRKICVATASDLPGAVESADMVKNILNSIGAAAYSINPETYRVTFVNSYLQSLLPEMRRGAVCYEALMNRTKPCKHCIFSGMGKDGDTNHVETYLKKLNMYVNIDAVRVDSSNGEKSVVFTAYDVTNKVKNEQKLHRIAYLDLAWNLKNQIAFLNDVGEKLSNHASGWVYMIRIRNFDHYNLTFGRAQGDEFLKELVEYYCKVMQIRSRIYRISGVKLAVIANTWEEYTRMEWLFANPVSQALIEKNQVLLPDIDFVGIEIPQYASRAEKVIHNLEYLLTKIEAKEIELSNILFFSEQDQQEMERNNRISSLVKQTGGVNGFEVYYQPIYSIHEKKFSKSEALMRLYDEELGWISPAEFVPIAETNGVIGKLGQFALEEVCKLLEQRKKAGLPPVQINVNVSAVQFATGDLYKVIANLLQRYDFDPALLHLEITESVMLNSFEYIIHVMTKIIKLGISFSIDDFGTGYSSLSYLGALPVRSIKLDHSFIKKMTQSDIHTMIVDNIIKFAKDLGFAIVAEGVEEMEQYRILKRLGCDYIQGYLLSKPLPRENFELFLQEHYEWEQDAFTIT